MLQKSPQGESFFVYSLGESFDDITKQILVLALENNNWNTMRTARALRLSIGTIKNWKRKYGLTNPNIKAYSGSDW